MAVSCTTVNDCDDRAFLCEYCAKSFAVKTELRVHLRTHTGEQPFQCSVCQRAFRHRGHLNCHMMIHTGEKPCLCQFCGKVFRVKSILKKHLRSHTGDRPYICGFCLKAYAKKESLSTHMNIHSKETNLFCKLCNQEFLSYKNICNHLKVSRNEKMYLCNLCPKNFPTKSELQVHLKFHYGKKPHLCVICNQGFSTKTYLQIHMEKHNTEKHYICDFCQELFNSQFLLNRHAKIHLNLSNLICGFCNNKFSSKNKLLLHFKIHTVKSVEFFFCKVCSKTFNNKERFNHHCATHEKAVYECEICQKSFSYKSKLSSHIRINHSANQKKKKILRKKPVVISRKRLCNTALQYSSKISLRESSKVCTNDLDISSKNRIKSLKNISSNDDKLAECKETKEPNPILSETNSLKSKTKGKRLRIIKNNNNSGAINDLHLTNSDSQPESSNLISFNENIKMPEDLSKSSTRNFKEKKTRKADVITSNEDSKVKETTVSCSVCPRTFKHYSGLRIHMRTHKLLDNKVLNEEPNILEITKENICTDNFMKDSYEPAVCDTSFLKCFTEEVEVPSNLVDCEEPHHSISSQSDFKQVRTAVYRNDERQDLVNNSNNEGWVLNSNGSSYVDIQQEIPVLNTYKESSSSNPFISSLIDREFQDLNSVETPSSLDILASTAQQKENIAVDTTLTELGPAMTTLPNYIGIALNQETSSCAVMEASKNENCTLLEGFTQQNLCICGFCLAENKERSTSQSLTEKDNNSRQSEKVVTKMPLNQNEKGKSSKQKSVKKLSKVNYELGEEAYLCEYCAKTFPTKNDLNIHILSHTGEKAFPCHLCNQSFRHKGHLNSHMTIHSGERPFLCQFCSKSFRVKSIMKQHLRSHTGERPFACGFCHCSFAKRDSFVKHLRTHEGEQCHSCKVCFKEFKDEKDFCKHIKSNYKDKLYKCKYCSKNLVTKRELHAHLRVHTEGRPFSCEMCLKSFTSEAYLIKHLQQH